MIKRIAASVSTTLAAALLLTTVLSGCQTSTLPPEEQRALSALRFPEDVPYTDSVDIVVVRTGGTLRLVNREARSFENVEIWLNDQYVHRVAKIELGESNIFALNEFINEHREPFPVGNFLQPELARRVSSAELFQPDTGKRYRIIVQPHDI